MTAGWQTSERDDGVHVTLTGDLDISSAPTVETRLLEVERGGPDRVIFDLRAVEFIDSTGLSLIINADARAQKAGRRFTLVAGEGAPRRVLRTVGLEERLDLVSDLPD
jgi:anti-sigma B factor antagonist